MRRVRRLTLTAAAALALALPFAVAQGGGAPETDPQPRLAYAYGENMRFGLTVVRNRAGKPLAKPKLLTFAPNGGTNHTMLRLGKRNVEFGGPAGNWVKKNEPLPKGKAGTFSVWTIGPLEVRQLLHLVTSQPVPVAPGVYKRQFDTLRVHYIIENKGAKPQRAGLRVMIDTLIGGNDGVPFTVAGLPGLVDTSADFTSAAEVPEFIQALERPDLVNPGTIAHLSLRPVHFWDPPDRLSLTHWVSNPPWDVPVRDIAGDSAVAIYWNDKVIKPGEKRHVGFAYGLGDVQAGPKGGNLAVTVGGAFEENTLFNVTAYVKDALKGQTVELLLPAGLELARGKTKAAVPPGAVKGTGPRISVVHWQVRAPRQGQFDVRVRSSTGPTLTRIITITERQKG